MTSQPSRHEKVATACSLVCLVFVDMVASSMHVVVEICYGIGNGQPRPREYNGLVIIGYNNLAGPRIMKGLLQC